MVDKTTILTNSITTLSGYSLARTGATYITAQGIPTVTAGTVNASTSNLLFAKAGRRIQNTWCFNPIHPVAFFYDKSGNPISGIFKTTIGFYALELTNAIIPANAEYFRYVSDITKDAVVNFSASDVETGTITSLIAMQSGQEGLNQLTTGNLTGSEYFNATGYYNAFGFSSDGNFRNTGIRNCVGLKSIAVHALPNSPATGVIAWLKLEPNGSYRFIRANTGYEGRVWVDEIFTPVEGATHYAVSTLGDNIESGATSNAFFKEIIDSTISQGIGNTLHFATNIYHKRQIINPPLPKLPKNTTLKVLFLGTSWMVDTAALVRDVALSSGLKVEVGNVFRGTFNTFISMWNSNGAPENYYHYAADGSPVTDIPAPVQNIITGTDWNVIVIGQGANESFYWDTFQPHLQRWVKILKMNATNPNVVIALNNTWTPDRNGQYIPVYGFDNQLQMWQASLDNVVKASYQSGIDLVIPSGMAIYSARTSSLQNGSDLTRDELHLDLGIGRYITACTVFKAIFKPTFEISVKGNAYRSTDANATAGYTPITDNNAPIAQTCAISANANRFDFTDLSSI